MALGQVFLWVLQVFPVSITPLLLHFDSCIIWGIGNGSFSFCSVTETNLTLTTTMKRKQQSRGCEWRWKILILVLLNQKCLFCYYSNKQLKLFILRFMSHTCSVLVTFLTKLSDLIQTHILVQFEKEAALTAIFILLNCLNYFLQEIERYAEHPRCLANW